MNLTEITHSWALIMHLYPTHQKGLFTNGDKTAQLTELCFPANFVTISEVSE